MTAPAEPSRPETRRLAQLSLMWRGRLGPMGFRRVVGHFGTPEAVLEASAEDLRLPSLRLEPDQIEALLGRARDLARVAEVEQRLRELQISVWCDYDPAYPALLHELKDRPPVLCATGRVLASDDPAVAIVGTRSPTPEGRALAEALGHACADELTTVISGPGLRHRRAPRRPARSRAHRGGARLRDRGRHPH